MLSELLEQDRCQEVRPHKAARRRMEGRGFLRDRLAGPACELLPHRLDHLPLARHELQRLRDVLAELRQPRRSAARARGRCRQHHPLPRQMIGEGFAHRPPPRRRRVGAQDRCNLVLGRGRRAPRAATATGRASRAALGALAIELPLQLLDHQLEVGDHRVARRGASPCLRGICLCCDPCVTLSHKGFTVHPAGRALRQEHRRKSRRIGRQFQRFRGVEVVVT